MLAYENYALCVGIIFMNAFISVYVSHMLILSCLVILCLIRMPSKRYVQGFYLCSECIIESYNILQDRWPDMC